MIKCDMNPARSSRAHDSTGSSLGTHQNPQLNIKEKVRAQGDACIVGHLPFPWVALKTIVFPADLYDLQYLIASQFDQCSVKNQAWIYIKFDQVSINKQPNDEL